MRHRGLACIILLIHYPVSSPNRTVVATPWVIILWAYSVCPTDSLWMSMGLYYPNILGMITIDYTENPMNQQCTSSGTTFRVLNTKKDARFVHPTPDHDTHIYIYINPWNHDCLLLVINGYSWLVMVINGC